MSYGPTNPQQHQQYLEQQIQNASPAQQLVMLYDGAIKFCHQTKAAIAENQIEQRCKSNQRVMEIVSYLMEILDMEKGGEISQRLNKIYGYLLKKLLEVDMKNSSEAVDEVIEHLQTLKQSWLEIAQTPPQSSAPQTGVYSAKSPATSSNDKQTPTPIRRSATA